MNKFILTGRVTKQAELTVNGNYEYTSVPLAVNRDFKNKNGERESDFIIIKAFGQVAKLICGVPKGAKILVEGRIKTGRFEKDGQTRYTTDMLVEKIEFLERKQQTNQGGQPPYVEMHDPFAGSQTMDIHDDDLPF